MTVVPVFGTAAAWLRRARFAFKKFVDLPIDRQAGHPSARADRLLMPPCVWYGRAVFGFYVQSTTSTPASETEGSRREPR